MVSTLSTQDISTMHILTPLSPSSLTEFLWHYIGILRLYMVCIMSIHAYIQWVQHIVIPIRGYEVHIQY